MNKIPLPLIEKYWHSRARTDEDIFPYLKNLHERQYLLMDYLMKADADILSVPERQTLYFYGTFIVDVMLKEFPRTPEVSFEVWEEVHKLNVRVMNFLESAASPEDFIFSMRELMDAHPQSDLFSFVIKEIIRDPGVEKSVRVENMVHLFRHLKVVADCLVANPPAKPSVN